jgi:hypothetical protein
MNAISHEQESNGKGKSTSSTFVSGAASIWVLLLFI